MAVERCERRWVEVPVVGGSDRFRVAFTTVDLGDGSEVFPALTFGTAPDRDFVFGGRLAGSSGPASIVALADLRELVRLADESPEVFGG